MTSLSVAVEDAFQPSTSRKGDSATKLVRGQGYQKKRKPRLRPPTAMERIFGQNKSVKPHYFTAGVKINESNQRNVHAEALPFTYPQDMEEFSYRVMSRAWRDTRRRKEMKLKYNERSSYRGRQKLDVLNRLFVKEPEVKSMKTIKDLDPEFFTIIEGRPVRQKFNRWDYISDVRDILRTKIVTGYREDEIMLIDENFIREQKLIDKIRAEFQKYVNTFEDFLFGDHTLSMSLLRQSELEAQIATEKCDIHRELSKEYGSLKSTVYNLEEKWRRCKMFQKFLYLVSPMEWRTIHDFYYAKRVVKSEESEESGGPGKHGEPGELPEQKVESSVFGRYKLSITGEVLSLEDLIEQFLDDVKIQDDPIIFFSEPVQLLKVFSFIEIQNLNTLLHSEELAVPLEQVMEGMEKIQNKFNTDMAALQEIIDSLEGGIVWEEERAKYLEELALELINGDFKELVSNDEVINLYVFVEDVYESRIGANDSNLEMSDMMRMIEMTYRDYLLQLDRLPDQVVYQAEKTCYAEEAKIMAVAQDAARKVIQVERLMKHLARLLEAPVYKTERDLKWRSPPVEPYERPPPPPKPLTEEESDYLTYFSDFCSHTDDPKDYGIRVHKVKKREKEEDDKIDTPQV